jgi:hypothetical protein
MPAKKPKRKVGRPRFVLDYDTIEKYAMMQFTDYEIAAWIEMSDEGFRKRKLADDELVGAIKRGRAKGCGSLRREQYKKAMAGDGTALIWMGKNYLGQSDKQDIKTSEPITVTIIRADRSKGE